MLPAVVWQGFYNVAVTGDPLVMPYKVHDAAYAACPTFLCQSVGTVPQYRHPELADFHVGWERLRFLQKHAFYGLNGSLFTRLMNFLEFFVGGVFVLPLVALWRNCRDRWLWLAAAVCGLVFLALTQTVDLTAHYAAPVTALVFVQIAAGMRVLSSWRWKNLPAGRWLAAAVVAVCVFEFAMPLSRVWQTGFYSNFGNARQQIMQKLESDGQRHLVFVRYSADHDCHREWVYNRADIDAATVVWAREISPIEDHRLRDYYANRKAWVVIADAKPPRLLALDDAALAAYRRRPNPYRLEEASRVTPVVR